MTGLLWWSNSTTTTSFKISPRELAKTAILEHQQSAYYRRWVQSNPVLGLMVAEYLAGGVRPSISMIGANHYGLALVLTEDIRRG